MSSSHVSSTNPLSSPIYIRAITPVDASQIAQWRYPPPYEIYSLSPEDAESLMRPEFQYYAALDDEGALLGYFCYGDDARIPAAFEQGLYADGSLTDLGLGMRPDRTGRGLGTAFLSAGLTFGERLFGAKGFRLTVAAWNVRAVRLYEKCGFSAADAFTIPAGGVSFLVMTRSTPRTGQAQSPR